MIGKVSAGEVNTKPTDDNDPLHVAMVVRAFSESGGLELYAHRLIENLLALGHRVTVICEVVESQFEHPGLSKVQFPPAPKARKAVRIKHHFQAASQCAREHGPFDVVHSQHLPMTGADVVTFHNHSANRLLKVGQGWEKLLTQAKMLYSHAYKIRYQQDEILCQSKVLVFPAKVMRDDFIATYHLNEKAQPPRYVVAHPGAEFPGDSPDRDTIVISKVGEEVPFTFLFVGKGFRKKGLDILFQACKLLNAEKLNFRLIIAGLREKPVDRLRLRALGIEKRVEYLGFRKDMHNVFAQAKASVLPSRIEPFGMAPIQGMLFGIVPIVSRVTGVSEVLTNEKDCLILQDHLSASELAGLMKRLMRQPDEVETMSRQAMETARRLSWRLTAEATLQAYKMVVSDRSRLK